MVDSGAAETVIPRRWFPTTKRADGSAVENEGEKMLIMSTADGAQLRKVTFQVANVNKALGSVSKMTNDILWLRERDGVSVRCGHDGSTTRKGAEEQTASWEVVHEQSLQVQMNQQRNMECWTEESCTRWMMTRR